MDVIETLNWRYATKKFDPQKKLSSEELKILTESLRLSPSSFGLQAWKFIVVESDVLKSELKKHSWNQAQVDTCSHYVVFTTLKEVNEEFIDSFISKLAASRSTDTEALKGYRDVIVGFTSKTMKAEEVLAWTQRQSYIAMGFLMYAAAQLKIDTCPMEGISPQEYDKLLGLEGSPFRTVAAVALGYRADDDKHQNDAKFRFDANEVIEFR